MHQFKKASLLPLPHHNLNKNTRRADHMSYQEDNCNAVESRGSLTGLGPLDSFSRSRCAKVWQVTPDTVLKAVWAPVEPYMMELVSSQTSIPIPKIQRCITWGRYRYLFKKYVEGSDLYENWPSLSLWRRFMVAWILRGYVRQLCAMELPNKDISGPIQPSGAPLRCQGH
jgi:hypothetical protein